MLLLRFLFVLVLVISFPTSEEHVLNVGEFLSEADESKSRTVVSKQALEKLLFGREAILINVPLFKIAR